MPCCNCNPGFGAVVGTLTTYEDVVREILGENGGAVWGFNDASGTDVVDRVNPAYNGSYANDFLLQATQAPGPSMGLVAEFMSGESAGLANLFSSQLLADLNVNNYSISAWVKYFDTGDFGQGVIPIEMLGDVNPLAVLMDNVDIVQQLALIEPEETLALAPFTPTTEWFHIGYSRAITMSPGDDFDNFYLAGDLVAQDAASPNADVLDSFRVGSNSSPAFHGYVSYVVVAFRTLTPGEFRRLAIPF